MSLLFCLVFLLLIAPSENVLFLLIFLHLCIVPFYKPISRLAKFTYSSIVKLIALWPFVLSKIWSFYDGRRFLNSHSITDQLFENLHFVFNFGVLRFDKIDSINPLLKVMFEFGRNFSILLLLKEDLEHRAVNLWIEIGNFLLNSLNEITYFFILNINFLHLKIIYVLKLRLHWIEESNTNKMN